MLKSKVLTCLIVFSICLTVVPFQAFADFQPEAGAAVLMEASTGQVIYEKNADEALHRRALPN
jgi:D-alanyl-D-alanine carboxypeptidase